MCIRDRSLGYGQDIAMSIGVSLTKTRLKNFIIEGIFLGLAAVISSSQRGSIAPVSYTHLEISAARYIRI